MKLKIYTRDAASRMPGIPKIRVAKSGLITINPGAAERIGIKLGDIISLAQDEERPKDWYLNVNGDPAGYKCRVDKNKSFAFNSVPITTTVLKSLGQDASISIAVGAESIEFDGKIFWPLITAGIK